MLHGVPFLGRWFSAPTYALDAVSATYLGDRRIRKGPVGPAHESVSNDHDLARVVAADPRRVDVPQADDLTVPYLGWLPMAIRARPITSVPFVKRHAITEPDDRAPQACQRACEY